MLTNDLKIFTNIPTLRTERLTLRRIKPSDLEDVYDYASDASVSKYLLWYPHHTRDFTAKYLHIIDKGYKKATFYDWGVTLTDTGKMIGTCGFTSFDITNNSAEIGYVLNSRYWGMGIAAEAAMAVITFGFEALLLHRIEAKFMPENTASRRVLEKCGFSYEGYCREAVFAKDRYFDYELFSIIESEYKKYRYNS